MARTKAIPTQNPPAAKPAAGPTASPAGKKRKWRPGTVALREIRRYQKSTETVLPRAPVDRVIREIANEVCLADGVRLQADAINAIHAAAEQYAVELFERAQVYALHGKRVTVSNDDFKLAVKNLTTVDA